MAHPNFLQTSFTADCLLMVDRTLQVIWCNGPAEDLLGGRRSISLCGSESPFDISALPLEQVWAGGTLHNMEVAMCKKRSSQETLRFRVTVEPVFAAPDREVNAALVVAQDIGKQQRALRRLEESNATWSALFHASPLPILAFGLDGNITSWNPAAERVFGWREEEVLGRPVPFIPVEKEAEHRAMRATDRSGAMLVNREIRRRRKDGELIDLSVSTAPVRDKHGALTGTICVYIDISERKKMEEQLSQTSRMESLGALAGGVAHDFNNALTTILGNASLALLDAPADSEQEEALTNIVNACERVALLTNQMLAYSGKGRFYAGLASFSGIVAELLPLIRATLGRSIALRLDLPEHLPKMHCDARQLGQVIMAIVMNAAESIEDEGEVAIRTFAGVPEGTGHASHVCLEIRDNGCGMDQETRTRMFDPFFSTKFLGRGLGLAAAIGIVRGHHGIVQVESAVGEGTCFRVYLPIAGQAAAS